MYKAYTHINVDSEDDWEQSGSNSDDENNYEYESNSISELPRTIFENIHRDEAIARNHCDLTIEHPDYFTGQ